MTNRRDSVAARLRKTIEEWNSYDFRRRRNAALNRNGKRDFLDESVWADVAREAFGPPEAEDNIEDETLGDREEEKVLMDAFWRFNLDPADPRDWRALLDIFADVLAPELSALRAEYKRAGAPKKWNSVRRKQLAATVDKLKREARTKITDLEACKRLKKVPGNPPHIRYASAGALVRQVIEGRRLIRRPARRTDDTPAPLGLWRKLTSS